MLYRIHVSMSERSGTLRRQPDMADTGIKVRCIHRLAGRLVPLPVYPTLCLPPLFHMHTKRNRKSCTRDSPATRRKASENPLAPGAPCHATVQFIQLTAASRQSPQSVYCLVSGSSLVCECIFCSQRWYYGLLVCITFCECIACPNESSPSLKERARDSRM